MQIKGVFAFRTYSVILLGMLGAAIGLVIFFYGSPTTPGSQALIRSPEFVTWVFVNEVLFALCPILLAFLWIRFRQRSEYLRRHWREILISSSLLTILYLFPLVAGMPVIQLQPLPLEYSQTKITLLETVLFTFSALPLAVSIWLIQAAAQQSYRHEPVTQSVLLEYLGWRDDLQRFLMIFALLLSLFIFTGAALRKLAFAFGVARVENYPAILLLVVGAFYSLVISLIYLPAYTTVLGAGNRLLDAIFPLPSPATDEWDKIFAKRKELEDFLELKVGAEQRLATTFTLLAPLVSSILSTLVNQ